MQLPVTATELLPPVDDATELLLRGTELGIELLETGLLVLTALLVPRLLDDTGCEDCAELDADPTIPKGAGCDAQVVRLTQLLLFSQPQPAWVVTQSGYKEPNQLH